MDNQQYIKTGLLYWIIQAIPDSVTGNNVTIAIKRLSDGFTWNFSTQVFESAANSGAMTFAFDIFWKCSFTPPSSDTYVIAINNITLDVEYTQVLVAVADSVPSPVVPPSTTAPTNQEMLANVNIAINNLMTGGAIQSYSINGRNLQKCSLKDLQALREYLMREIAAGSHSTTSFVRFKRTGGSTVRPDTTEFTRLE